MDINIVKADKDYRTEIERACKLLNLGDGDYTVEFYFGQDVENDYERIYGSRYSISGGAYSEKGDRIFIKKGEPSIITHELSHLKFNKLYTKTKENVFVLDFIDEYLAKKSELFATINFIKENETLINNSKIHTVEELLEEQINCRKKELEAMSKKLEVTTHQLDYMRRIANMIAWREYLIDCELYDYSKNMQYDLINGLSMWNDVFDDVDYNNINEKYNEIEMVYKDYEKYHLENKNLDKKIILD
ncbi:hypothetical protein [Clostridium uliginosum]|uniref:Uncharacterized protein n=1 Tax=Clostridium uliginosum TaxID=119641 RepID=A0A1I1GZM6_9CLOT|nr:hypothetical protein [Clostridium uliginosum]SFC14390.1 hypothetical protein SAMN05421842_10142 [Clostridium uliginosum]